VPAQYISQWGEKIFILHATVTRMLIEGSLWYGAKKTEPKEFSDHRRVSMDILHWIHENVTRLHIVAGSCGLLLFWIPVITFLIKNLKVIKLNIIKDKHISVILKPNTGSTIKAICFNCLNTKLGHYLLNYKKKINIIAQIHENIWNNKKTIQLNIKDLIL
jgi:hypothetical protein